MNLIDERNNRLKNLVYDLINSNSLKELLFTAIKHQDILDEFEIITTAEDFKKTVDPFNIKDAFSKYSKYFAPYFPSNQLYFYNKSILTGMLSGREVSIAVDHTIMFDSNFSTYIHKFINDKSIEGLSNDFYSIIGDIILGDWNFDFTFYLLESYKNIRGLNKPKNSKEYSKIVENITSLELFKNINRNHYSTTGKIKFDISFEEAFKSASEICEIYYFNEKSITYLEHFYLTKQFVLLALIGMVNIKFKDKRSSENKMISYFEFVQSNIGINLDRETILAYEYFKNSANLYIMRKINKNIEKEKLLEMLDNIAWDFMIPRVMEFNMAVLPEGDFILPYFLSFDDGLIRLLNLLEPKGVVIDKKKLHTTPFRKTDYIKYFNNDKINENVNSVFNPDTDKTRTDTYDKTKNNIQKVIERELEKMFE